MECILSLTMAQMFTYDKTIKNYYHRSSEKVGLKRRKEVAMSKEKLALLQTISMTQC